jgi:hypothetical protein
MDDPNRVKAKQVIIHDFAQSNQKPCRAFVAFAGQPWIFLFFLSFLWPFISYQVEHTIQTLCFQIV